MPVVPYPDNNITNIVDLLNYVNSITDVGGTGFFGVGILIIIGFVSFFATKAYSFSKALGFSAFLTMIAAIFLRFLNLINDSVLLLFVVIFVISLIFLMKEDRYVQT